MPPSRFVGAAVVLALSSAQLAAAGQSADTRPASEAIPAVAEVAQGTAIDAHVPMLKVELPKADLLNVVDLPNVDAPNNGGSKGSIVARVVTTSAQPHRGALLPSLYVSLAALNAYDAYTTTRGYKDGAAETNALLRGAASKPAVVWAIKGGITAASVAVAEQMWRSHHRVRAIGMMAITNSIMAVVAARNGGVLRNQQ
jgi:hypothetical protein